MIRRPGQGVAPPTAPPPARPTAPPPARPTAPPSTRPTAVLAALAATVLCVPAAAAASEPSGGGAMGPPPSWTAHHASLTASAAADGMTITARESTPLHMSLQVNGTLSSSDAGSTVEIELMGARTGWSWQSEAQTTVQADGSYTATVKPKRAGQYAIRAVLGQSGASAAVNAPTITVIVYRASTATLYGPGFWGHRTACGKILRRSTIGVANRTLPCGTPVAVYYRGQMMVVPVIDRGPYANGANWDLTMATGRALGMFTTETIGAAPVPVQH